MARVQLIIPDADREQFVRQARREGMTLSAWLRAAAHERLRTNGRSFGFENMEALEDFIAYCDSLPGPEREPDWEEHLAVLNESKTRGLPDV